MLPGRFPEQRGPVAPEKPDARRWLLLRMAKANLATQGQYENEVGNFLHHR
jgi:hypothetical protein